MLKPGCVYGDYNVAVLVNADNVEIVIFYFVYKSYMFTLFSDIIEYFFFKFCHAISIFEHPGTGCPYPFSWVLFKHVNVSFNSPYLHG